MNTADKFAGKAALNFFQCFLPFYFLKLQDFIVQVFIHTKFDFIFSLSNLNKCFISSSNKIFTINLVKN